MKFTTLLLTLISQSNAFSASRPQTPSLTSTFPLKATWSNGQAIKEYQDFLNSGQQEIVKETDGPSVVVRSIYDDHPSTFMVAAIASLGNGDDVVLQPGNPLPPALGDRESYPIYVVVPPPELRNFLINLPDDWKTRREDFVFLSGGNMCGVIEHVLKEYGYARDSMTQLLCGGFTTPGFTGKPSDLSCQIGVDASGENKWAGETATCGKWAGAIQERFERNGIRCKTSFYREWRRLMWERASFDAVFNLIGFVRKEPTTLQDVALYYEQETSEMLWQVTSNLRGWLAVTLTFGFEERIFGFAEQRCAEQQCFVSEEMFPYLFCTPIDKGSMINEYLNYAKDELGLLQNTALPKCDTKPSMMRQGNLRADGVI